MPRWLKSMVKTNLPSVRFKERKETRAVFTVVPHTVILSYCCQFPPLPRP